MDPKQNLRIGWISSHAPKHCGIATFSRDLMEGISTTQPATTFFPVAVESEDEHFTYPDHVVAITKSDQPESYAQAAEALKDRRVDVLVLQHEYGLFGGRRATFTKDGREVSYPLGDNIFELIDRSTTPLVTTLHTVLPKPDRERREVIRRLADRSTMVVTMTHDSRKLLEEDYAIDPAKLAVIAHGVPTVQPITTTEAKAGLGLPTGEPIMMITGLIGANKGIELALRSLPDIIKQHPKVQLYVVGQTHPNILLHSGEEYRESIKQLAAELGVADHLKFVNKYLPLRELVEYMLTADVYLTLHRDPEQAASGTLAYAVGAGLVALSTPYRYAKELLADGRGFLVPFDDSGAISATVNRLLSDPALLGQTRNLALKYGQGMHWPAVGQDYLKVITDAARTDGTAS